MQIPKGRTICKKNSTAKVCTQVHTVMFYQNFIKVNVCCKHLIKIKTYDFGVNKLFTVVGNR